MLAFGSVKQESLEPFSSEVPYQLDCGMTGSISRQIRRNRKWEDTGTEKSARRLELG